MILGPFGVSEVAEVLGVDRERPYAIPVLRDDIVRSSSAVGEVLTAGEVATSRAAVGAARRDRAGLPGKGLSSLRDDEAGSCSAVHRHGRGGARQKRPSPVTLSIGRGSAYP